MHVRVVASRLRAAECAAEFIELSREFAAWLTELDGHLSYELIGEGLWWSDRMCWRDAAAADSCDRLFESTHFPARFGSVVDRYMAAAGEPRTDLHR